MKTQPSHPLRLFLVMLIIGCFVCPESVSAQGRTILLVGNSITKGDGTTDGATITNTPGFRDDLFTDLQNAGIEVTFVGSRTHGPNETDFPCFCAPSARIRNFFPSTFGGTADTDTFQLDVGDDITAFSPNTVAIHLGTNDILGQQTGQQAGTDLRNLLTYVFSFGIVEFVIVSQIIPFKDFSNTEIVAFNNEVTTIASEFNLQGKNVLVADHYTPFDATLPGDTLYFDSIHPNNAGYAVMGQVYFNAINSLPVGVVATDDFNRADGQLFATGKWAATSQVNIVSTTLTDTVADTNAVLPTDPIWTEFAVFTAAPGNSVPKTISMTYVLNDSLKNTGAALLLRANSTNFSEMDGYICYIPNFGGSEAVNGNIIVQRIVDGAIDTNSTTRTVAEIQGSFKPKFNDKLSVTLSASGGSIFFSISFKDVFQGTITDFTPHFDTSAGNFAGIAFRNSDPPFITRVDNFNLTTEPVGTPQNFRIVSGNDQTGQTGTPIDPFVVSVTDAFFNSITNIRVDFSVVAGGGSLSNAFDSTDTSGEAATTLTLGAGTNTVLAIVNETTLMDTLTFTAFGGTTGEPAQMSIGPTIDPSPADSVAAFGQTANVGTMLPDSFVVSIKDFQGNNPTDSVEVEFMILSGGGSLPGGPNTISVFTDTSGVARTALTLGTYPRQNTVQARAVSFGLAGAPITFKANGVAGPPDTVEIASGNNQTGTFNAPLDSALVIVVRDAFDNRMANVQVKFQESGNGTPSPRFVFTDVKGEAVTNFTVGTVTNETVTASLVNFPSVPGAVFNMMISPGEVLVDNFNRTTGLTLSEYSFDPEITTVNNELNAVLNLSKPIWSIVALRKDFPDPMEVSFRYGSTNTLQENGSVGLLVRGNSSNAGEVSGYLCQLFPTDKQARLLEFTDGRLQNFTPIATTPIDNLSPLAGDVFKVVLSSSDTLGFEIFINGVSHGTLVDTDSTRIANITGTGTQLAGVVFENLSSAKLPEIDDFTLSTAFSPVLEIVSGDAQPDTTVGATLPDSLKVRVRDNFGNPMGNVAVAFEVASGGGTLKIGGVSTDTTITATTDTTNGQVAAVYTLGSTAGVDNNIVLVSAGTLSLQPLQFTFTALAGPLDTMVLTSADTLSGTVGDTLTNAINIRAEDSLGNPKENVPIKFKVTGTTKFPGGLDTLTVNTDSLGVAAATVILDMAPDTSTIEITNATLGDTISVTVIGEAGPPNSIIKTGNGQTGTVGQPLTDSLVVRVFDLFDNPLENISVEYVIASGEGTLISGGAANDTLNLTTDASGRVVAEWTLRTFAGTDTVNVTVPNGSGKVITSFLSKKGTAAILRGKKTEPRLDDIVEFFVATAVPDVPDSLVRVDGDTISSEVNTTVTDSLGVKVTDQFGNGISSIEVIYEVTDGTARFSGATADTVTTDTTGLVIDSLTLDTQVDTNTVNVIVNEPSLQDTLVFTVIGIPDQPDSLALTNDNQQGTVGQFLDSLLVVIVLDQFNNPVPGEAVTYAVTSGGGSLSGGSPPDSLTLTTDAFGQTSAQLFLGQTAGTNTVSVATATLDTFFVATAVPGEPINLVLISGDSTSQASVPRDSTLANPLVVEVTDQFSNAVQGETVTFKVISGGGTISLVTPKVIDGAKLTANDDSLQIQTDASGQASVNFMLGTDTTDDSIVVNEVQASATVPSGSPVSFLFDPVNQSPTGSPPQGPFMLDEGASIQFVITANDADGDSLIFTETRKPLGSTFVDSLNGMAGFSWTPTSFQAGVDTLIYSTTDPFGGSDVDTVSFTIRNVNRPPLIVDVPNDTTIAEGDTLEIKVSVADPDTDDVFVFQQINSPTGSDASTLTADSDTSALFKWIPSFTRAKNADADTFDITFTVDDGNDSTDAHVTTIIVNDNNRIPTFVQMPSDTTGTEEQLLEFDVVVVDPDTVDNTTVFSLLGLPQGASTGVTPGARADTTVLNFSWTPTFEQGDSTYAVTFTANDGAGGIADSTISIVIGDVNRAPGVSSVLNTSGNEGTLITFPVSANDADGDTLEFGVLNLPAGAVFDVSGTFVGNGSVDFVWTPDFLQKGTYEIFFTVKDIRPDSRADTSMTTIVVDDTNRAPQINVPADTTIAENDSIRFFISVADVDTDNNFTFDAIFGFSTQTNAPSFVADTDTSFLFTWRPDYARAVGKQPTEHAITFDVDDNAGGTDSRIVRITVNNTNRQPTLEDLPADTTVVENQQLQLVLLGIDPDLDDTLNFGAAGLPVGATIDSISPRTRFFNWKPDFTQGGLHVITFAVNDGEGGTDEEVVRIFVDNTNRAPEIAVPNDTTITENQELQFDISATDPDGAEDILSFSVTGIPVGASFDSVGVRLFRLRWKPTFLQAGIYDLTFSVDDNRGGSDSRNVRIRVTDVNRPPVLVPVQDQQVAENDTLEFTVQALDADEDNVVRFNTMGLPTGAGFDSTGTQLFQWIPNFEQSREAPYVVTFIASDTTFNTNITATSQFEVLRDTITVNITVTDTNRPPVFISGPADTTIAENKLLQFNVTAEDADGDPLTLEMTSGPTDASFTDNGNGIGTFSWTPGFDDAGTDSANFIARDNRSGESTFTTIVTVGNVNGPPELAQIPDTTIVENQLLVITVTATDPDADNLTFSTTNLPDGATFNPSTRTFSWKPTFEQGKSEGQEYQVTFIVTDGRGGTDQDVVTITVFDVNRNPTITDVPSQFVNEGQLLSFTVTATDPDGDNLTFVAEGLPNGAGFNSSTQRFSWVPNFDQGASGGKDYFVGFAARDNRGGSDSTVVKITVADVNRNPSVVVPENTVTVEEAVRIQFVVSAFDLDADSVKLGVIGLPQGASFDTTATADSTLSAVFDWTPSFGQSGIHQVIFTARDNRNGFGQVTVIINVGDTNGPPVLDEIPDTTVNENQLLEFTVTAVDPDGDALTFGAGSLPQGATFINQLFSWRPNFDQGTTVGRTYTIRFFARDDSLFDEQDVRITVLDVNRAPSISAPSDITIDENQLLTFTVAATDLDGDNVTLSSSTLPSGASFNTTTGVFMWQPDFTQAGVALVTFMADDGRENGTASKTTRITVEEVDNPPQIFSLVSPPNGATINSLTPTFTWQVAQDDPGDQVTYTLVLDTDSNFTTADSTTGITITSFTLSQKLAFSTTYFWFVRASDRNGNPRRSTEVFSFTTSNVQTSQLAIPSGVMPTEIRVPGTGTLVRFISNSIQGTLTVVETFGTNPGSGRTVDPNFVFPRFWNISSTMTNGTFSFDLTLEYNNSELPAINENNLNIAYFDQGQGKWQVLTTERDTINNKLTIRGLTQLPLFLAIGDFTPPEFTFVFIQNPILTSKLDIYVIPSRTLVSRPSITVGAAQLIVSTIAATQITFYVGDFTITTTGALVVAATGIDLFGTDATTTVTFSASLITVVSGGVLASYDDAVRLTVDKGSVTEDTYLVSSPMFASSAELDDVVTTNTVDSRMEAERQNYLSKLILEDAGNEGEGPNFESYVISPVRLEFDKKAELVFNYDRLSIAAESSRLGIYSFDNDTGNWNYVRSYVDVERRTVTAFVGSLGAYRLQLVSEDEVISSPEVPNAYSLGQNYPNPFNPSTTIPFTIPDESDQAGGSKFVTLSIYDVRGNLVKKLVDENKTPGSYLVHWNGVDTNGSKVSSGIYIYRIMIGNDFSDTKKLILLK